MKAEISTGLMHGLNKHPSIPIMKTSHPLVPSCFPFSPVNLLSRWHFLTLLPQQIQNGYTIFLIVIYFSCCMPNLPVINRLQECPGWFRSGLLLPIRLWDWSFKWADFYLFLSEGSNQRIKLCTLEFMANKTKTNVISTWSRIWHWTIRQHLPASISFA